MSRKKELAGLITGLVAIVATACFIIIGFITGSWHPTWLVFLAVPITAIVGDIVTNDKDISGAITGAVAVFCAIVFLLVGFVFHLWTIAWIVFLLVPMVAIIMNIIKVASKKDGSKKEES